MARRPQATITHKAVIDQTSVADECQRKVPPLTPTVGADSPRPKKWRGHCQKQPHGATLEKCDETAVSATVAQSRGRIRRSARPRRRIWTRRSKVAERRLLEPQRLPIPIEKFQRRPARDDAADLGDGNSSGSCRGVKR